MCGRGGKRPKRRPSSNGLGLPSIRTVAAAILTVVEQQIVEIAKALSLDAKIPVMDEASGAMTQEEVTHLFEIVRDLKAEGLGIIDVSHRIEEIFTIADRVIVLRDGEEVDTQPVQGLSQQFLVERIVGRAMNSEFPAREVQRGPERLCVEGLRSASSVQGVSFRVHAGEVLGFAGLVGAGRTETMRLVFGADARDAGDILVEG